MKTQTSAVELAIQKLPQLPQVQYSLHEQLSELRQAAIKLGLYDADDYLKRLLGIN